MDYLGRPVKNNFNEDINIHGNDIEGVKDIQAKELHVENKINCTSLVVNNIDVEIELLILKDEIKRLNDVIKHLVGIDLDVSDDG